MSHCQNVIYFQLRFIKVLSGIDFDKGAKWYRF